MPLINQAYWFITINASEKDPKYQTFEKPHLQAYFNNYPEPVRQILDKQNETGIQKHDLYDMKPLQIICKSTYSIVRGHARRLIWVKVLDKLWKMRLY